MVRRGEVVRYWHCCCALALLLCAGAAIGQPSGGIPPRPQRVLFANLGTPQDSNWRFCADCNSNTSPCTGGGSGAFAYRVGSAWVCSSTAAAMATPVTVANGGTGQSTYTKGDLLAAPGGATLNKVSVGTDGQVWTADSASTNGVKWAAAASSGVTCPSCTNNVIPKTNVGGASFQDSSLIDNGSTIVTTESITANAFTGGTYTAGTAATVTGTLRFFNVSGIRSLTLSASVPAASNRTIDFDWSALTATRTLKFGNGTMDLAPLVTPTGTGNAVFQTASTLTGVTINTSVTAGTGMQHIRVASCTTGATVFSTCDTTVTWAVPFADANYTVTALIGAVTNTPTVLSYKTKAAGSIVITIINDITGAASGTIDVIAMHD